MSEIISFESSRGYYTAHTADGCVTKFFKIKDNARFLEIEKSMISFKGEHLPKDVILYAVFFYFRYGVSYCDLEEIMEERGVNVDHATLNRWVIDYSSLIAAEAKKLKRAVATP